MYNVLFISALKYVSIGRGIFSNMWHPWPTPANDAPKMQITTAIPMPKLTR